MAEEDREDLQEELTDTPQDASDLLEDEAAEATEVATEAVESAAEDVAEATAEAADTVEAAEEAIDERVETAVRNVAEEAADEQPARKKRERRSKQARAAKGEDAAPAHATRPEPVKVSGLAALGVPAWLGISAACLAVGLLLGRFALGGGSAAGGSIAGLDGTQAVTEEQLDDAYATYTYKGATEQISIREVIEQTGTIESALDADGNYTLPAAEYALSVARNHILNQEAESRGIEVSDDEVAEYAEQALGTSDYDAIASTYGMDAEAVEKLIYENCRLNALRDEVVDTDLPDMPEAPADPAEDAEDKPTKEYADYIIALAGDEWDDKAGAWASEDGRYATALEGYELTADGATYEAAQAAYYVAYQEYSEKQSEASSAWSEFMNGLMSAASIQVGTLVS